MTATSLTGVILAAGKGSRMNRLPTELPKPVLPLLDKPIIFYQLQSMARLGIRRAVVVVGYRGFEIVRQIERLSGLDIEIEYVHQEEALGIAHCVGRLEHRIDGPFLLFLGDMFFHAPRLREMLDAAARPGVDAVLGAILEADDMDISRNYCIITDDTGRATRVVEKPRYPQSRLKGVGIYLFHPVVFDAIRRTPRTAMRNEYEITDSIQILIDDGYHVRPSTCIERDLNITYPRDVLTANLWILRREGIDRYVAESAKVGEGVTLEDTVIGGDAVVGSGASLKNTVVFARAVVPENARLDGALVTESGVHRV